MGGMTLETPQEPIVQTETVYMPRGSELTVQWSITAGDLLVASLLTALIAVIVAQWIAHTIFKGGRR